MNPLDQGELVSTFTVVLQANTKMDGNVEADGLFSDMNAKFGISPRQTNALYMFLSGVTNLEYEKSVNK